ncbi:unnamed protein product [Rotaria magnacalcarata]|uniref:Uncharacterized protein n=1 Tax=Rotaria magnacalcarata TaxID=392030 RepID=A0A816DDW5_9BILA|nr:unnamed protein product [Rotaria magnacalcarata]CAF1632852.1 unnamed protein product [Rotaria magnacalcarata]CAF3774975.1 unnamed protein product [Rotaria magnacalcarata]CAF3799922.1 unnamed protein product [Rotaria magnacalcarata]
MPPNSDIHLLVILLSTLLLIEQLVPVINSDDRLRECRQRITYDEMKHILEYHPCVFVDDADDSISSNSNSYRQRVKRRDTIEHKIHTLNKLINEHRTMIKYLLNTFVNVTLMKNSIYDYHENTGPSLRSWRDITDLICLSVLLGSALHVLILGCRFLLCHRHPPIHYSSNQNIQLKQELQEHKRKQIKQFQIAQHTQWEKCSIHQNNCICPSTLSFLSHDVESYHDDHLLEHDNSL